MRNEFNQYMVTSRPWWTDNWQFKACFMSWSHAAEYKGRMSMKSVSVAIILVEPDGAWKEVR